MNITEVTKYDIEDLDEKIQNRIRQLMKGRKVGVIYCGEGHLMTYKWMGNTVDDIMSRMPGYITDKFAIKNNLPAAAGSCLIDELETVDLNVFSVYAILDEFSQHPVMFQRYGYRRFTDFLNALGISVATYNFIKSMTDDYTDLFGHICHIVKADKIHDIAKSIRIVSNGNPMPIKMKNPIVKLMEEGIKFLMDCKYPPVEYIPEDEWYLTDSVNERKAPADEMDALNRLADNAIENDNDNMEWNGKDAEKPLEERNEGEIVVEKKLSDTQKLIGIKVGMRIKYLVVASDFDVSHAPQIYSMMVREELKIGKNFTTDRLSRMLEISQLTEAGFTTREIADYFEISKSMVSQDKRETRHLTLSLAD